MFHFARAITEHASMNRSSVIPSPMQLTPLPGGASASRGPSLQPSALPHAGAQQVAATTMQQHPLSGMLQEILKEVKMCNAEGQKSATSLKTIADENKLQWALIAQQHFTVENSSFKV